MVAIVRADTEIQADVLAELAFDPCVKANEIGVRVKDGIVTLYGTVDSYLERVEAQQDAHRVHGVRAVANELDVRLPAAHERSDEEIAQAVAVVLRWDVKVPHDRIAVTVTKGRVTLSGEVLTQHQRAAAEHAVRRLIGVRDVNNHLTLATPTRAGVRDSIEAALRRSAETDAKGIRVDVRGGTAVLTGHVRTWAERADAERAAWSAPGITSVENHLAVHQ